MHLSAPTRSELENSCRKPLQCLAIPNEGGSSAQGENPRYEELGQTEVCPRTAAIWECMVPRNEETDLGRFLHPSG